MIIRNQALVFLLCLLCSPLAAMDTAATSEAEQNAIPNLIRLQKLQNRLQPFDFTRAGTFANEPDGRILRNMLRYMARSTSAMFKIVQKDPAAPFGNALSQTCTFLTNCATQLETLPTTTEQSLAHYIREQLKPFEKETKRINVH